METRLRRQFNKWRYLGYSKEVLAHYEKQIAEDNLKTFSGMLLIAGVITALELVFIYFFANSGQGVSKSLWMTEMIVLITAVGIIVLEVVYQVVKNKPNKAWYSRWLTTVFLSLWSILYIVIGTVIDSDDYAVVACGLMLLVQVIFNAYPIENMAFSISVYIVFAVLSFINKPFGIFAYDMVDALPFLVVGQFLSWIKSRSKWAALIHEDTMVQLQTQKLENELLQSRFAEGFGADSV